MVDDFLWKPEVIVDTTNSTVVLFWAARDQRRRRPGQSAYSREVDNMNCFVITFDQSGNICKWTGYWDNEFPPMLAAMGEVTGALDLNSYTW